MPGLTLTLPIAAGKVEAWRRFCQDLSGWQRKHYVASRRRLGITRERLVLVESLYGSTSVTTLEADDMGLALAGLIGSDLPFESWYRERLQDLHGLNLMRYEQPDPPAPLGMAQEVHFEWPSASARN